MFQYRFMDKDADTLIKTLPDSIQQVIRINEQNKTYISLDYKRATAVYYDNFLSRNPHKSSDIDSLNKTFGENVYGFMWGPSEFKATGNLKDYDHTNLLGKVKIPVLLTCGNTMKRIRIPYDISKVSSQAQS